MNSETEKKRGFGLATFLVLLMISNTLTALSYFTTADMINEMLPNMSKTIVYFLGWLCVLNALCAFGVWHWKKVAINGLYAIVVLMFAINIYLGFGVSGAAPGLITAALLFLLTRNKMKLFE